MPKYVIERRIPTWEPSRRSNCTRFLKDHAAFSKKWDHRQVHEVDEMTPQTNMGFIDTPKTAQEIQAMIPFSCPRCRKRSRLVLALMLVLVLSLCFAGPASAHGGEGDELQGPAPAWMIGLIYPQLLMIPAVGLWLFREAIRAWLPQTSQPDNQGV